MRFDENKFTSRLLVITILLILSFYKPFHATAQTIDSLLVEVQKDSNDYIGCYKLGVSYLLTKQYEKALHEFEKSLIIYPRFAEGYFAIYCTKLLQDEDLYEESMEEDISDEAKKKLDVLLAYTDKAFMFDPFYDRAIAGFFSPRGLTWEDIFSGNAGFKLFFQGYYSAAIGFFSLIIEKDPQILQIRFLRGIASSRIRNNEDAVNDFTYIIGNLDQYNKTKILPIYIKTMNLYYAIGCARMNQGKYWEAEKNFKLVLEQDMSYYMAHAQLSNLQLLKGNFTGALNEIDAALLIEPNDAILHSNRGVVLAKLRRFNEANDEFILVTKQLPRYSTVLFNIGQTLETMERYDDAIAHYNKYIERAATRDSIFVKLAKDKISKILQSLEVK